MGKGGGGKEGGFEQAGREREKGTPSVRFVFLLFLLSEKKTKRKRYLKRERPSYWERKGRGFRLRRRDRREANHPWERKGGW